MKKAKLEMETLGKIILLSAFLIMILLMFVSCKNRFTDVGKVTTQEYLCFITNTMEHYTPYFPTSCRPINVEEEVNTTQLSSLIRKCWWMYGKGQYDLGGKGIWGYATGRDELYLCYSFEAGEDIDIKKLKEYMMEHDRGIEIKGKEKSLENSDWNFLVKGTKNPNPLCFKGDTIQKDKVYYLFFYDDRRVKGEGVTDSIWLSKETKPSSDEWCIDKKLAYVTCGTGMMEYCCIKDCPSTMDKIKTGLTQEECEKEGGGADYCESLKTTVPFPG